MTYNSKYLMSGSLAEEFEVVTPATTKKRVKRNPRGFALYTYRGAQFMFTYNGDLAVVSMLNKSTHKAIATVTVTRDKAYIAARALGRILEAEELLATLKRA